jgi:uncharacterized protein YdcH (DUF465 family)
MTEEETKKHLCEHDPQFQRLKEKHQKYKEELGKMKARSFLTPEEKIEQKLIKKKKLRIKDEMQEMINAFQYSHVET